VPLCSSDESCGPKLLAVQLPRALLDPASEHESGAARRLGQRPGARKMASLATGGGRVSSIAVKIQMPCLPPR